MRDRYDYIILGGGVAGGYAADSLRQAAPKASIGLFSADPHRPYNRPPLSKEILLGQQSPDMAYLHPESYYADQGIELHLNTPVTQLDLKDRLLTLQHGGHVAYDKLLYAAGAQARQLPLPGEPLTGVYTLRTMDDCLAIQRAMKESKRAVVIGGSFIGAEVTSALVQNGVQTTMVFPDAHLFGHLLDEGLARDMDGLFTARGVRLLTGHKPQALAGAGKVEQVIVDDGEQLPCDMVVIGIGVRLNVTMAEDAGLQMSPDRGIRADRFLQTSDPHVWVAGDDASYEDVIFGMGHLRVEHWDTALSQGMLAAGNMAGAQRTYDHLPYFFSLLFGMYLQVYGSMQGWDQVVERGAFSSGSYARFYFRQGAINAVLATGRPFDELQIAQQYIRERRRYDDIAAQLANEAVPLGAQPQPA